jgi:hypothetical protein
MNSKRTLARVAAVDRRQPIIGLTRAAGTQRRTRPCVLVVISAIVAALRALKKTRFRAHIPRMENDHPGWIVIVRDGDDDEFPRRFAVYITDPEKAVWGIAELVLEQSCLRERPMTIEELDELGLKPGEWKQL